MDKFTRYSFRQDILMITNPQIHYSLPHIKYSRTSAE